MGKKEVEALRKRMATPTDGKVQDATRAPEANAAISGDSVAPRPKEVDTKKGGGMREGIKTVSEKDAVAKEIIARAKAEDVEDSREETSGDERHDSVVPSFPNIPPSIQQERMRMGQHPITGEPWTHSERRAYERELEDGRIRHAMAVREAENKMRADIGAPPALQPILNVPTSHLTPEQKEAMQRVQDEGGSPAAVNRARDENHPDEIGRRLGDEQMTKHEAEREEAGIDEDIERQELGEEDEEVEVEEDPSEVEAELDKK